MGNTNYTDKIISEIVKNVKSLPDKFEEFDGYICKRSVWREFSTLIKQDNYTKDSFTYKTVKSLSRNVFTGIGRRGLDTLYRENEEIYSIDGFLTLSPIDKSLIFVDFVFQKVMEKAKNTRFKTFYQKVITVDEAEKLRSVVDCNFESGSYKGWDHLKHGVQGQLPTANSKLECIRACEKQWAEQSATRYGRLNIAAMEVKLPGLISSAIDVAKLESDFDLVVQFTRYVAKNNEFLQKRKDLQDMTELLEFGDPALFFSFARKPILSKEDSPAFVAQMFGLLSDLVPKREAQIAELLLAVVRRLEGDFDAVYPLLHGLPGTAKTFLIE